MAREVLKGELDGTFRKMVEGYRERCEARIKGCSMRKVSGNEESV